MKLLSLIALIIIYSSNVLAICTVNIDSNASMPESSDVQMALFHHGYDISPVNQNNTVILKYETKLLGGKCDGAQIGQRISCSVDAQLLSESKKMLASGSYSNVGCVNAMSSDYIACGGYARSFILKNLPKCERAEVDFEDPKFFNATNEEALITNKNYYAELVHLNNNRAYFPIRFGDRLIHFEISKEAPGAYSNLPEREKTSAFISSVDVNTGKALWRTEYNGLERDREVISTWIVRAARIKDTLILGWSSGHEGGIRALNINTGVVLWEKPNWLNTMFIVSGDVLFLPGENESWVTAISSQSGKPFWKYQFKGGAISDNCVNMSMVLREYCPLLKDGKLNILVSGWDRVQSIMFSRNLVIDAKTGDVLSQSGFIGLPRKGMP
ncbi:MAG: PQQ-binding-like beta-propeller repeat protein [Bdellovibrionales bacterium]